MRLVLPALAALFLAPAALAQAPLRATAGPAATLAAPRLAPGDTVAVTNVPEGTTSISTWQFGEGNFLFGTNDVGILGFGSAYAMPDDGAPYEVIGSTLFVTAVPEPGATFEVSVYAGTAASGPTGDPLHTETFATDLVEPRGADNTIAPTVLFFETPVAVEGREFFLTYDVGDVPTDLGVGATADLNVPVPESVIRIVPAEGEPPAWVRVDQAVTAGEGNPLQVYLFGDALLREPGDPDAPVAIVDARASGVGARVVVEGVVSRSNGANVYLQDETGGLVLRQTSGNVFDEVATGGITRGTRLRVAGTLSEFNGLLQINGGALESVRNLGNEAAPEPQVVTFAEIAADGEAYEGELVQVVDVTLDALDPGETFAASTDYAAADPSGAGTVRILGAADTDIDGDTFTAEPAIVTGVVIQNSSTDPDGGYQVAPLIFGDVRSAVVAVGERPDGRVGLGAPVPNPAAGTATVVVTLAAAGRATLAVYDVLGREVARVLDGPVAAGATAVAVDVAGLPAGTYLVRLTADGAAAVRTLTVAR